MYAWPLASSGVLARSGAKFTLKPVSFVIWAAVWLSEASVAIKNISLPFSYPFIRGTSISTFALESLSTEQGKVVELALVTLAVADRSSCPEPGTCSCSSCPLVVGFADSVQIAAAINKTATEVNAVTHIFGILLLPYVILRKSLDEFV